MVIDAKTDKYAEWNPYAYTFNTPVRFIDDKAMKGYVSMKDFVIERFNTEKEAVINVMKANDDLARDGDNFKDLLEKFKGSLEKVKNGEMTKEDLINSIVQHGMENNPNVVKAYKIAYGELYDEGSLKGINEADKKKQEKQQ